MNPQNIVEGALPLLAAVFVLVSSMWDAQVTFVVSLASLALLSAYLFLRKNWK